MSGARPVHKLVSRSVARLPVLPTAFAAVAATIFAQCDFRLFFACALEPRLLTEK